MRSPARFAPYVLLALAAALVLLLSGGGVGQAQTTEQVLVSNHGQTFGGTHTFNSATISANQEFTTGSSPGGYALTSIELSIETTTSATAPTVTLRSGSATTTEGQVVLTGPGSLELNMTKAYTFTAPAGTMLAANTKYWVVVQGVAGVNFSLRLTNTDDEDATPAAGWSIADTSSLSSLSMFIRVNGTINPVPRVLVSNYLVGETETETFKSLEMFDVVQRFTTGVGSGEFTLSSIEVRLKTATDTTTPTMKLLSGSAQGTEVATLTGPSALDANTTKDYEFTPSSTVTLTARTQYWVFIEGGAAEVVRAETYRAEETAEPGWTLQDSAFARDDASEGMFNTTAFPMLVRVKGNLVDLPAEAATGVPTITAPNVFRVPAVLTADLSGIFDVNGIADIEDSVTYKWQRFNAAGTTLEMDSIGTDETYTLADADAGKTIKVVVSFTDDGGGAEEVTSAATEAITAAATCAAPTYTGGATQIWTGKLGIAHDRFTIGDESTDYYGYIPAGNAHLGSLGDITFTAATDHVIRSIENERVSNLGVLIRSEIQIAIEAPGLSTTEVSQFAFHICDERLLLGDSTLAARFGDTRDFTYEWDDVAIDWSTHAERTLYISRDQVAPTLSSAAVDGTELTLTFTEELGEADSLANTDFEVKRTPDGGTEETLTWSSTAPVISGRAVTLTLDSASSIATTDTGVKVSYTPPTTGTDNKIVDRFGNEVAEFTDEEVTIGPPPNLAATGKPEIIVPNTVFRVPADLFVDFEDVMDGNGTTGIADSATYVWKRYASDGTTLEDASIGTDASYALTSDDVGKTIRVDVTFTDDDGYTETLDTSDATAVITAAATCAAPTLTGGAVQIWTSTVKFDRLSFGGDLFITAYTGLSFSSIGGPLSVDSEYTVDQVQNQRLYMDGSLEASPFEIVLVGTAALSDLVRQQMVMYVCDQPLPFGNSTYTTTSAGNHRYLWPDTPIDWSTHAGRTVYISRDQAAPTLSSATVDGTELTLTFTEELGAADSLANSDFGAKRTSGGTEGDLTLSSTAPVISGKTVTLTLASASSVAATDTDVKVSYTPPTTGTDNKIVDRFGNEVAAFTDQPVTNLEVAVSNLEQPTDTFIAVMANQQWAQSFCTGPAASTLDSVQMYTAFMDFTSGSTPVTATTPLTVAVHSDNSGKPGPVLETLTNPPFDTEPDTLRDFTSGGLALAASTRYWVTVGRPEGSNRIIFFIRNTGSTLEDSGTDPEWSIGNRALIDDSGYWRNARWFINMKMAILAGVDEPDTSSPAFADRNCDGAPDPLRFNIDENSAPGTVVGTVPARDYDGDSLTYSISGTDATRFAEVFELDANTGRITVKSGASIDFESLVEYGWHNPGEGFGRYRTVDNTVYEIAVNVTDGEDASGVAEMDAMTDATVAVEIEVINIEELGSIALSAETPTVGSALTATLSDPDGIFQIIGWEWLTGDSSDGPFTVLPQYSTPVYTGGHQYTPTSADLGKYLAVYGIYLDIRDTPGGFPYLPAPRYRSFAMAVSVNAVGPTPSGVTPNTRATGAPGITGTLEVGQTLTATTSDIQDADGLTTPAFTYRWIRYNAESGIYEDIEDATNSTYTLTDEDEGQILRVRVTFTDDAGNSEMKESPSVFTSTPEIDLGGEGMEQQAPNSPPTGDPGISGTLQVGQTLTADTSGIADPDGMTGAVFTYQWIRVDLSTTTDTDTIIEGANSATYTATTEDGNKGLKVLVTFTDDAGNEETVASNTYSVIPLLTIGGVGGGGLQRDEQQPAAPVITTTGDVPVQEGATFVGLLEATDEDTGQAGLTWSVHGGADSSHFTLTPVGLLTFASAKDFEAPDDADTDGRYEITVQVTDGTNSVTGDVRAILLNRNEAPAASAGPDQAGIAEGATVTLSGVGTDPDSGDTLSYAWTQTDGATVTLSAPGAASTTFAAPTGLTGNETLRFTLRVSDAAGLYAEDTVEITVVASSPEEQQSEQTPPALTATTHDVPASHDGAGEDFVFELHFSETPEEGFSYETVRDDTFTVTGGSVTYVRRLEAGKNIEWEITVTPSDDGNVVLSAPATTDCDADGAICTDNDDMFSGLSEFTVSGPASQQAANNEPTGAPAISGTPRVGETLTATTSGIADADGMTNAVFTYRWILRDLTTNTDTDTDIEDGTGSTYVLADADEGKAVKVRVTFTDDAGHVETSTSAATEAVSPRPNRDATGAPAISGTPRVGETLTATTSGIADADGMTDAVFAYRWVSHDLTTQTDTDIEDATSSTYTVTEDDQGKALKVRVTFTDDAGHEETLTSAATAAVPLPPLTATTHDKPAAPHDGENAFTFELRFSETPAEGFSYKTLKEDAFTVTGGAVLNARRLEKPHNVRWEITVRPDGNADVVITLPATTNCDHDGAICTDDGRMLSIAVKLTVKGPSG